MPSEERVGMKSFVDSLRMQAELSLPCQRSAYLSGVTQTVEALTGHAGHGFYAYDNALLVRSIQSTASPMGMMEWRHVANWGAEYSEKVQDMLWFAEDIFGCPFGVSMGNTGQIEVVSLDLESGHIESLASSIGEWCAHILADSDVLVGSGIASAWQIKHGKLQGGYRLVPKVPFVVGGLFEVDNLYALEERKALELRLDIHRQIRSVPDGTTLQFRVVDDD